MLPNAFIDKPRPTDQDLTAALGSVRALWDRVLAGLTEECKIDTAEWHSYSRKAGWSLRVKREQRTILYLSPSREGFTASFALGGKAVEEARQSRLPARVLKIIDEAKRYAEGTAVRIDVTRPGDVGVIRKLAAIKLRN